MRHGECMNSEQAAHYLQLTPDAFKKLLRKGEISSVHGPLGLWGGVREHSNPPLRQIAAHASYSNPTTTNGPGRCGNLPRHPHRGNPAPRCVRLCAACLSGCGTSCRGTPPALQKSGTSPG